MKKTDKKRDKRKFNIKFIPLIIAAALIIISIFFYENIGLMGQAAKLGFQEAGKFYKGAISDILKKYGIGQPKQ